MPSGLRMILGPMIRPGVLLAIAASIALAAIHPARADAQEKPSRRAGVVTTGFTLAPAGMQTVFGGRVTGVVFGGDDDLWVLTRATTSSHTSALVRLAWKANRVASRVTIDGYPGVQAVALNG